MLIEPQHYPIVIFMGSVIVVPLLVKGFNYLNDLLTERQRQKLDAAIAGKLTGYATTEELDVRIDTQQEHMDRLHKQNQDLLHAIKEDGLRREGMILGQLKQAQDENRANDSKQENAMSVLHGRIDRVLELSGERRGR